LILEAGCGIVGYLAFLDHTEGDILNNFLDVGGPTMKKAANVARGLLCTTMFFVYPMDSFVCRHVLVVIFFRGRRAHEGDDAAVLSRRDRRVAITLIVYFSALIPALLGANLGSVLAVTGTIGASCLAYIGPGLIYMAVYGKEFLQKVDDVWEYQMVPMSPSVYANMKQQPPQSSGQDLESSRLLGGTNTSKTTPEPEKSPPMLLKLVRGTLWYLLLMPIWVKVAHMGKKKLTEFQEKEALKSPHINRLGKCAPVPQLEMVSDAQVQAVQIPRAGSYGGLVDSPLQRPPIAPKMIPYQAMISGNANKAIGAAILAKKKSEDNLAKMKKLGEEEADIDVPPTWWDFCVAIFFIAFGIVALFAGMVSIIMTR
jgi:sodium-coupled neutral amino acid transporter 11